jgi:hypothetical protein
MRRRTAVSLIAASLLFGCARQPAMVAEPGMQWFLTPDVPKLALGRGEGTDDVLMMMECRPRSGGVDLAVLAPAAPRRRMEIASGPAASRFAAKVEANEAGDGVIVEARASADDLTLVRFAKTGELAVGVGGGRTALPAARPAQIAAFLTVCRR